MSGKCRPSLRPKTLENVMYSNLSQTDKECIKAVFERFDNSVADKKVSHPDHYTYGKIECIDFILDKGLDFPLGNAIKYIVRAGRKCEEGMTSHEKTVEDLKKAIQYIQFEIEHLEGKR